jgi:hypothetical protein
MLVGEIDVCEHFDTVTGLLLPEGKRPRKIEKRLHQLATVLAEVEPSRAYQELHARVLSSHANFLIQDEELSWMVESYHWLDRDRQAAFLRRSVDQQAEIINTELIAYGGKPYVAGIRVTWGEYMGTDRGLAGVFPCSPSHMNDDTYVNPHLSSLCTSPFEGIITTAHEQWHHFNVMLQRAVRFNWIDKRHPLYADGLYFKEQWDRLAFYKEGEPYERQMDERMARAYSSSLREALEGHFYESAPLFDCGN